MSDPTKNEKDFLFDSHSLSELKKKFILPRKKGDRQHQSYPDSLAAILNLAVEHGFDPYSQRALDLGSGIGYVTAALASSGCRTYGIEFSQEAIDIAIRTSAPLELSHQPQFIKGDYLKPEIEQRLFSDGTTYQEMDLFYCFVYNPKHAITTILRAFAAPSRAKEGALIALTGFYPASESDFFEILGIKPLFLEQGTPYSLFRKDEQRKIPPKIELKYNYQESL
jgi:SAM-dependent methyltransferase